MDLILALRLWMTSAAAPLVIAVLNDVPDPTNQ